MTIEEKAQRYDEAIKTTRKWYDSNTNEGYRGIFEDIFPELKNSENKNEKIRQALVKLVTNHASMDLFIEYDIHLDEAIAWLEKQGEQKPIIEMKSAEESLGIDSETYNKIVDECIYGDDDNKPAWSEEDKEVINLLLELVYEQDKMSPQIPSNEKRKRMIYWLKSLRPQNTWKPSDEQMLALETAVSSLQSTALESLYQKLNKLM